jgi:hypothetical protein
VGDAGGAGGKYQVHRGDGRTTLARARKAVSSRLEAPELFGVDERRAAGEIKDCIVHLDQ